MGAIKFLLKYLAPVPNSSPNTQTNQLDVHNPNESVDVPEEYSGTPQSQCKRRYSKQSSNDQEANSKIQRSGPPTGHVREACREPEQNLDPQLLPDMSCVPTEHVRVALNNTELLQEKNQKAYQTLSKNMKY